MIRTWRKQTLTGNAQPWFGDVLTAALLKPVRTQYVVLTVADTTLYQVGDRIWVNFGLLTGANLQYIVKVNKILTSTTMQCQSESDAPVFPAANASIIALANACFRVDFATPANAAPVYLGTDNTVTSAGAGSAFLPLAASSSFRYEKTTGLNPLHSDEGWMAGGVGQFIFISYDQA